MITAIVYSRPSCMKCHVTHKHLKKMQIPVQKIDIDEHPDKIAYMQEQGWMELPLVEAIIDGETHYWSGMSTSNLQALGYLHNTPGGGGDAA